MDIAKSNEPLAQRISFLIRERGLKQLAVAARSETGSHHSLGTMEFTG